MTASFRLSSSIHTHGGSWPKNKWNPIYGPWQGSWVFAQKQSWGVGLSPPPKHVEPEEKKKAREENFLKENHKRKMKAQQTYLMCAEGQQLQYGNYVSQFGFVQRKVFLLVCVALRILHIYMIMISG